MANVVEVDVGESRPRRIKHVVACWDSDSTEGELASGSRAAPTSARKPAKKITHSSTAQRARHGLGHRVAFVVSAATGQSIALVAKKHLIHRG